MIVDLLHLCWTVLERRASRNAQKQRDKRETGATMRIKPKGITGEF